MDFESKSIDTYSLITDLCKHFIEKHCSQCPFPGFHEKNDVKTLRKLRSKAFEILLNKTNQTYDALATRNVGKRRDPVEDIFKYISVLKLGMNNASKAKNLENLLDELPNDNLQPGTTVYSTLQLIVDLKNYKLDQCPSLDTFFYGENESVLPNLIQDVKDIQTFQIYPIEYFISSNKFQSMLDGQHDHCIQHRVAGFTSGAATIKQHPSMATVNIQSIQSAETFGMVLPYASQYSTDFSIESSGFTRYFTSELMGICSMGTNYLDECVSTSTSYFALPQFSEEIIHVDNDSVLSTTTNHLLEGVVQKLDDTDIFWDVIDIDDPIEDNYRNWENFGKFDCPKQMLFITDRPDSMIHLARVDQTTILPLLPQKAIDATYLLEEIPVKQFLSDVKLLLLGIESTSFVHINKLGFALRKGITMKNVSVKTLTAALEEVIHWGNCFKSLSNLVDGKIIGDILQQESPMFKALCNSVKEILLFYQASLLKTYTSLSESGGLLQLFEKVRPIAFVLSEVARLCRCADQCNPLPIGGSSILTHIYEDMIKVTNPKVALSFYSILQACCQVYFRYLQKWIFDGDYDDIYGEFMIKAQPQYLRIKGYKFWTKGFVIDNELVPGFLKKLVEPILQCGKTVRLLKNCDPKNPLCNVSTHHQPSIKVCLSDKMLREQTILCQKYEDKGTGALGSIVSLSLAIEDQKRIEKERVDRVSRANYRTLLRIKREQKERLEKIKEEKRHLLLELKEQAEQAQEHKEREKEEMVLADKLLLEKMKEEERTKDMENALRNDISHHHERLEKNIRRIHSDWQARRMKLVDKRLNILSPSMQDIDELDIELSSEPTENDKTAQCKRNDNSPEIMLCNKEQEKICSSNDEINTATDTNFHEPTFTEDMNSNIAETQITYARDTDDTKIQTQIMTCRKEDNTNNALTAPVNRINRFNNERSDLQDFLRHEALKELESRMLVNRVQNTEDNLEILSKQRANNTIERPTFLELDKFKHITEAQYNKLKVLQQEYGTTPNNNEANIAFFMNKTVCPQLKVNDKLTDNMVSNDTYRAELDKIWETTKLTTDENKTGCAENSDPLDSEANILNNQTNTNTEKLTRNVQTCLPTTSDDLFRGNIVETPMSCTTDNFTLSASSPASQLQVFDEDILLNADVSTEMLTSSESETTKSRNDDFVKPPISMFSGFSPITSGPTCTNTLIAGEVDMIDNVSLQIYLEKSVIIPLKVQSRLVNKAIIEYLLNNQSMLQHLHSLRSYYFLLNGEFAKCLTDSLYTHLYSISTPIELFNSGTLTNLLKRALINGTFRGNYENSEFLSLSAIDIPSQLHISDPGALDCLCLRYKISWPLNIILDETVMIQYSKVFKFLLMIGRVSWVLQEDFNIMKVERKCVRSEQYHKLQLYRHSMMQFINAFHNYLTCSVLHASWAEFEKDLQHSLTLDQIYMSHITYVKRILSRCMLNASGEKIRSCLSNIFTIILKFHNRLRSRHWISTNRGIIHPNFKSMEQMYEAFCELRMYVVHVALKLTTSGYQPHLVHFLDAININKLYDLTEKSVKTRTK